MIDYASTTFTQTRCCVCDIAFYMTDTLCDQRRLDGKAFYCPNGHAQSFSDNTKERLRIAEQSLAAAKIQLDLERDQKAAAEAAKARMEGSLHKLRQRVKNGICPCCHRSFSSLQRHIANKHPDYAKKSTT